MAVDYTTKYREEINKLIFGHEEAKLLTPLKGVSAMRDYVELTELVNVKIKNRDSVIPTFLNVRKFTDTLKGINIKRLKSGYWKELLSIIKEINTEVGVEEIHFFEELKDLRKKNIRIAFHPFPDTRLPHHFRYGISNGLNLSFRKIQGWSSSENLFARNETDIQLHSFSQAIILEKNLNKKFVFIPLFHFEGYGLILKKDKLNLGELSLSKFLNDQNHWKDFLRENGHKVVVEGKSDFHWMLKKYYEKIIGTYNVDFNEKIIDIETQKGKQVFTENDDVFLYSTNWVHFDSLKETNKDNLHIIQNDDFYPHLNLNGFILLKDFFTENKKEIKKLIDNWFDSLNVFEKEFKEEKKKNSNSYIENSHIFNYCNILNIEFGLDISPSELQIKFEAYNEFYKSKKNSQDSFNVVTDDIADYIELSNFNNSSPNSEIIESDIKDLIKRSKEVLKKIE